MQEIVRPSAAYAADRFLTFAFAAAELLVETDADGRITFAEGAFPARFGRPGARFLGRPVQDLVARDQRSGMGTALELLSATGRIRPTAIRLADRARSPFSVAGLAAPGRSGAFCLTFSPLPNDLPGGPLPGGPGLARAAEEVLRGGEENAAVPVPAGMRPATVTSAVNLRAGPDNDAEVVKVLPERAAIQAEADCGWCRVSHDGTTGYVYKSFIEYR